MRLLLEILLPLLLPALIWVGYGRVERRRAAAGPLPWWASVPWLMTAVLMVGLLGAGLFWFALSGGAPVGSVYQPAHMEDGRLVPGGYQPPPRPQARP